MSSPAWRPHTPQQEAPAADSLDGELYSDAFTVDPYPTYRRLRDEDPVHWVERTQHWLITRYDDVNMLFPRHELLSNFGFQRSYFSQLDPGVRRLVPLLEARSNTPSVLTTDPPEHTRLRRAIQEAFSSTTLDRLEQIIRANVDRLLNAACSAGPQFDFMAALAYPLPALVLADLLGIPPRDHARMQGWSTSLLMFISRPDPTAEVTAAAAVAAEASFADWFAYLEALVASRRDEPLNDLATVLVSFGDADERLTTTELISNFVLFMGAGHETTTGLLANGLHALLAHPEQLADLRAERSLIPAAVEEMLRWETPVQRLRRAVARDFELGGKTLRRGDSVELTPGAANRDPRRFQEPDRFDIHRVDARHVSFGKGIHFCVGAGLGRLEAKLVFEALLDRFHHLRRADGWQPTWVRSSLLRRLTDVWVQAEW